MYVDLWGWFRENTRPEYNQFREISYRGWRFMRAAQAEIAYNTFLDGLQRAQRAKLPCWELFFEYWACEVLIYHMVDRQTALDKTVRLAARAHQPQYSQCPVLGRVYFILADIYVEVDVYGYEDKIRDALDGLEEVVPMDIDTHMRVMHVRAYFDYAFQNYDEAEKKVQEYMPLAQDERNSHRQHDAYRLLRRIAYVRGNFHLALSYGLRSEQHGDLMGFQQGVAEERMWQGIFHILLGNEAEAHHRFQAGMGHYKIHHFEPWLGYYDAQCAYLEYKGDAEQALKLRYKQLEQVNMRTSIFNEGQTHVELCRLLGRIGQPVDEALKAAKAVSKRMRKPAFYLKQLQQIEAGQYYEFEWQKRYFGDR
jgi:hypothetical protein